jgi:hypothetical protein
MEFVPPGDWRTVAVKRAGRFAAGIFFNPSHWAFGIEIWTATFSLLVGPICVAFAPIRIATNE